MKRPLRWLLVVAAAWFAVAGIVYVVMALVGAWSAISAGLDGCMLSVDGLDVRLPVAADPLGCSQRVDAVSIALSALAGIVLLITLGWLAGSGRGSPE